MCGTPEYLAPEILAKKGHGKAVDWYSLGALMYEMLTGLPPYYSRERRTLFEQIRHGELSIPDYVSTVARDLLRKLLVRDPARRLGSSRKDGMEVMEHEFYASVQWRALLQRRVSVPFRPLDHLESNLDLRFFDEEFTTEPQQLQLQHPGGYFKQAMAKPLHRSCRIFSWKGFRGATC
eukprot:g3166.t1